MKKLLLSICMISVMSAHANSGQKFVSMPIEFDKDIYVEAIQTENQGLLYKQVPVSTVETQDAKEIAKQILVEMVEIRARMEASGVRENFSADDHMNISDRLHDALNKVEDLEFKSLAHNLNTDFNIFLLSVGAKK